MKKVILSCLFVAVFFGFESSHNEQLTDISHSAKSADDSVLSYYDDNTGPMSPVKVDKV